MSRRILPLLLLLTACGGDGASEDGAGTAKAAPVAQPAVAGALTEKKVLEFIELQTAYKQIPAKVKGMGLSGMAAARQQEQEFANILAARGYTFQTWSKLYSQVKRALGRIEEGRDSGLPPIHQADVDAVKPHLIEVSGAFQQ